MSLTNVGNQRALDDCKFIAKADSGAFMSGRSKLSWGQRTYRTRQCVPIVARNEGANSSYSLRSSGASADHGTALRQP